MSTPAQEFWGIIKWFGPLAALQVIAFVCAVAVAPDNYGVQIVSQLTVTMIAAGAGYNAGKREGSRAEKQGGDLRNLEECSSQSQAGIAHTGSK